MATASFTWAAWDTTNAWQNLADAGNSSSIAYARDATDVAGKFTQASKSTTSTEYARKATSGDTWETIFGIAANSTITAAQLTAWKRKLVTNTKLTSHSLTVKLINDSAGTIATLISAGATSTSTDSSYTAQTAGSNQTGLSIASNTNVRLSLEYACVTSGTSGSAAVDCRWDDFQVTITYTTPATYTTASNLDALVQKTAIEKSASLNALVQKTGIVQTSNLGSMIQKQNLTSAASLNALAQKAALTVPVSLNAVLANITLLNRMTDVTLSGTPRVCISNSLYFKVFPTRAGSETPDVDRAAWKTYDDSTLSGTPQRLGFAYAGSLYWVKGYTTPSATANPTGDNIQNVAFAVPDATLSGDESVFRIISGGDYYYFKAFLDTVITLREVYTGASLDAVLALGSASYTVLSALNAMIAAGKTSSANLNSLLQKAGLTGTANLNALIRKDGVTGAASLNALVQKLGLTSAGSLDARLAAVRSATASLNSLLQKQGVLTTASLNALIAKTYSVTASLNALVQKTGITGAANLGAFVQKTGVTSAGSLDARLAAVRSATASLNSLLQKQGMLTTASLNALIAKTYSVTANLDSLVKKTGLTGTANLDALVKKTGVTGTGSLDAKLRKDGLTGGANLNALLCAIHSVSASLGSLLQKQGILQNTGLDARIQKTYSGTASLNAFIKKGGILTAGSLDALLAGIHPIAASLDSRLQKQGIPKTVGLDAIIQQGQGASGSLDALLQKVGLLKTAGLDSFLKKADIAATTNLDALLIGLTTAFTSLDALLKKTVAATTGLDALLFGIQDLPLRVCWRCKIPYMEDPQMYLEPERCPKCGAHPDDKPQREAVPDFYTLVAESLNNQELTGPTLPSGDLPLRVCPQCNTTYMEDPQMYLEPGRCPKCGYYPDNIPLRGEGDSSYAESKKDKGRGAFGPAAL